MSRVRVQIRRDQYQGFPPDAEVLDRLPTHEETHPDTIVDPRMFEIAAEIERINDLDLVLAVLRTV